MAFLILNFYVYHAYASEQGGFLLGLSERTARQLQESSEERE